jgi:nitrite reductase/ring-hydroxylating ferredoxin subunit
MNRREFIKGGCTACLSVTVLSSMLGSCTTSKYVQGVMSKDGISASKSDFMIRQNGGTAYASFIIIRNEALQFPICLYRHSDTDFAALWMKCSHQGAELQVTGDVLHCPAHGSEFSNNGQVKNGPASENLRTFPVTVRGNEIFIDLRKK